MGRILWPIMSLPDVNLSSQMSMGAIFFSQKRAVGNKIIFAFVKFSYFLSFSQMRTKLEILKFSVYDGCGWELKSSKVHKSGPIRASDHVRCCPHTQIHKLLRHTRTNELI